MKKRDIITLEISRIDAVKMMREARDKISLETQDMSFEQLKVYIKQELKKDFKFFVKHSD